ncbi:MAG: hypothetical protein QOD75_2966 [Blastocatellia bacterium]|jgi:uncharacterized membrane protein|nr:hypothetical protein [Blastocatellia bacterium]
MKPKKSKYDTNPLEEDVAQRAADDWGAIPSGSPTADVKGATRDVGRTANEAARLYPESEEQTRRLEDPLEGSYPSVFIPPAYQTPPTYQPPPVPYQPSVYAPGPLVQSPGDRHVAGLGLQEKWATILPYLPFHIGAVAAAVELFVLPRPEGRARFHAAQGLALQLAILAIGVLFGLVSIFSGSSVGSNLFSSAATIFLIISMVRVGRGKPHHIAPLTEPAKWLEEHIKPRNK